MQQTFRVLVNWTEERRVASTEEIDCLCNHLAKLSVFVVHVTGVGGEIEPTLDVFVESGRAVVGFLDIVRGIKLGSCDEACTQRGVVSLRNDAYPELELDQIEVHHRDLISPERALSVLRHFLNTGEVIDLVRWPPDDWADWGDILPPPEARVFNESEPELQDDIPF